MSELKRQVSAFRDVQKSKGALRAHGSSSSKAPSLFLSQRDAAAIDVSDILEKAQASLAALADEVRSVATKRAMLAALETLLHASSLKVERETLTQEESGALNVQLDALMWLLAPLYGNRHSHNVLEYLIRHYRVQELSSSQHTLLTTALPYHDTALFARIVTLCYFPKISPWSFLSGVKESKQPMPRSRLVKVLKKEDFLLQLLVKDLAQHAFAATFVATVLLELLHDHGSRAVSEGRLRLLYTFVMDTLARVPGASACGSSSASSSSGAASSSSSSASSSTGADVTEGFRAATMVLVMLGASTQLTPAVVSSVLDELVGILAAAKGAAGSDAQSDNDDDDGDDDDRSSSKSKSGDDDDDSANGMFTLDYDAAGANGGDADSGTSGKRISPMDADVGAALSRDAVVALAALAQSQHAMAGLLTPEAVAGLAPGDWLATQLSTLPKSGRSALLRPLVLATLGLYATSGAAGTDEGRTGAAAFLTAVVREELLEGKSLLDVCEAFLRDGADKHAHGWTDRRDPNSPVQAFFRVVGLAYPLELERRAESCIKSLEKQEDGKVVDYGWQGLGCHFFPLAYAMDVGRDGDSRMDVISEGGGGDVKQPASLLLALQHPSPLVRSKALLRFVDSCSLSYQTLAASSEGARADGDDDHILNTRGLADAAARALTDSDADVRTAAWASDVVVRVLAFGDSTAVCVAFAEALELARVTLPRSPVLARSSLAQIFRGTAGALAALAAALAHKDSGVDATSTKACSSTNKAVLAARARVPTPLQDLLFDAVCAHGLGVDATAQAAAECAVHLAVFSPALHIPAGGKGSKGKASVTPPSLRAMLSGGLAATESGAWREAWSVWSAAADRAVALGAAAQGDDTHPGHQARRALLCCLANVLGDAESEVPVRADFLGRLLTSLLAICHAERSTTGEGYRLPELVMSAVRFLEKSAPAAGTVPLMDKADTSSFGSVLRAATAGAADEGRWRMLLFLLSVDGPAAAGAISALGALLEACFGGSAVYALLSIAAAQPSAAAIATLTILPDSQLTTPAALPVPEAAVAGALRALTVLLQSAGTNGPVLGSVATATLLLALHACANARARQSDLLRAAGQTAVESLSRLKPVSSTLAGVSLTAHELVATAAALAQDSGKGDPDLATATLRATLAVGGGESSVGGGRPLGGLSKTQRTSVARALGDVVVEVAQAWPAVAAPAVAALASAPMDVVLDMLNRVADACHVAPASVDVAAVGSAMAPLVAAIESHCASTSASGGALRAACVDTVRTHLMQPLLSAQLLGMVARGWARNFDADTRKDLHDVLVAALCVAPGNAAVSAALQAVPLDAGELMRSVHGVYTTLDASAKAGGDGSGLARPVQLLASQLEALLPSVLALPPADVADASQCPVLGACFGYALDCLRRLCSLDTSALLHAEYTKGLVMRFAFACLQRGGQRMCAPVASTASKKGGKLLQQQAANKGYATARAGEDIEAVLECLQNLRTVAVKTSALALLQGLMALDPVAAAAALGALGDFLSTLAGEGDGSAPESSAWRGLLLSTLGAVLNGPEAGGDAGPQGMLEALCLRIGDMSSGRCSSLAGLALQSLGDGGLAPVVGTLLAHCIGTYDGQGVFTNTPPAAGEEADSTAMVTTAASTTGSSSGEDKHVYIILSRNAERAAERRMRTSRSEDLFHLAVDMSVRCRSVEHQLAHVGTLLRVAGALIEAAAAGGRTGEGETNGGVHALRLGTYATKLCVRGTGKAVDKAVASAGLPLAVLLLEYVFEVLESKHFHRSLARNTECDADVVTSSGGSVRSARRGSREVRPAAAQAQLLALSEEVMSLLAVCGRHMSSDGDGDGATPTAKAARSKQVTCVVGTETVAGVDVAQVASGAWEWSMDILSSMQRLLDTPTFVAILQELIQHRDSSIRAKALAILTERLEDITGEMSAGGGGSAHKARLQAHRALFLDLLQHLRKVLSTLCYGKGYDRAAALASKTKGLPPMLTLTPEQAELPKSVLLCIDVLVYRLGEMASRSESWALALQDTLEDAVALMATLSDLGEGGGKTSKGERARVRSNSDGSTGGGDDGPEMDERATVHGSAALLASSLVGALQMRALPCLGPLMGSMLASLEKQTRVILADSFGDRSLSDQRARALLVRSTLSAVSAVVTALPTFTHTFMLRVLQVCLPLTAADLMSSGGEDGAAISAALLRDVQTCLTAATTAIPPSRSLPVLRANAGVLLGMGPGVPAQLASLVAELFSGMERPAVLGNMQDACALAGLLLDHRRAMGEQGDSATEAVDSAVVDATAVLLFKFTESELRQFILRLADWRDAGSEAEDTPADDAWRGAARATVFFRLMAVLSEKLRGVFVPTLALVWEDLVNVLTHLPTRAAKKAEEAASEKKGASKRGRGGDKGSAAQAPAELAHTRELTTGATWASESIRLCCLHDATGFVDESRFEAVVAPLVDLLGHRDVFSSDAEYSEFAQSSVTPALVALACAAAKDTLWKPMNHRILLLTRHSSDCVKTACLATLHALFQEVGEEYLILLPECIPFLAELLEEDNRQVTAETRELIQYIEGLSGESLDTYLQ